MCWGNELTIYYALEIKCCTFARWRKETTIHLPKLKTALLTVSSKLEKKISLGSNTGNVENLKRRLKHEMVK